MKSKLANLIAVLTLFILAASLIFYRFTAIPKYLSFDEVEFTKLALSLDGKPYTPFSLLATGHSTLYFYIILLSLKIFGVTVFALRLPAAVFGILSVLMFYLVVNSIFQKRDNGTIKRLNDYLPFVLSFIFLTSRWFLNFARFAFEPTLLLLLELTSIYFLLRCFKSSKWYDFVISGFFAGLAFNSYTPGRIFFLLPLGLIVLKKQWNHVTIKQLLFFAIPFIITITPLTSYLLTHQDSRIDQQFFLGNNDMTFSEKASGLWHNISSNGLMFFVKGDINGRHNYPGKPAINPILGILFVAGFIKTLRQWSNETISSKLFLIYFSISFFPTLMTYPWENPNMLRTYTVIPSVIYFVGQGLIYLSSFIFDGTNFAKTVLNRKMLYFVFAGIIALSSVYELRTYFKYQSKVFEHSFEIRHPLDKAIKMKNPYDKSSL